MISLFVELFVIYYIITMWRELNMFFKLRLIGFHIHFVLLNYHMYVGDYDYFGFNTVDVLVTTVLYVVVNIPITVLWGFVYNPKFNIKKEYK